MDPRRPGSDSLFDDAWVDAAGVRHAPAAGEVRIVSLVPSITELLFDLGLGERVVGRTGFCIHPRQQVARLPRVGGPKTPRLERLASLQPSHVIVNVDENRREDVEAIARFAPSVIVTHPLEPRDNLTLYRLLGNIFGRQCEAERLCRAFEQGYRDLRAAARDFAPRRVLYLIWRDPWMTVSRDTYISRTLGLANWHTVCEGARERYPEVSFGEGTLAGVDIVLFSSEPFPFKRKHQREVRELTGDTRTRFAFIDGEMTSWYGSRAIAGLRYLGEVVTGLDMV